MNQLIYFRLVNDRSVRKKLHLYYSLEIKAMFPLGLCKILPPAMIYGIPKAKLTCNLPGRVVLLAPLRHASQKMRKEN